MKKNYLNKTSIIFALMLFSLVSFSQLKSTNADDPKAKVTVSTIEYPYYHYNWWNDPNDPEYAEQKEANYVAFWVTKADGTFIKSLRVNGKRHLEDLGEWANQSGGSMPDGGSSATIRTYATDHELTWDCTDANGSQVADGDYKIWFEYMIDDINNGAGPHVAIQFKKSDSDVTVTVPDQPYLKNIKLVYTSGTTAPPVDEPIADFKVTTTDCSATVTLENKSINAQSYSWKFGDGETSTEDNPSHTYSTPGSYEIELTAINGDKTNVKKSSITINFTPKPTNVSGVQNNDNTVTLTATITGDGVCKWYEDATGGTAIGEGESFTTPVTTTTVFYAENAPSGGSGTISHGGKTDKGTTGEYYVWEDSDAIWGLAFDAKSDFTLKSVKIYNQGSDYTGSRTFTVKDASGAVIATKDIDVVDGEQRLNLNFSIAKGDNYRLLAENPKKGIWRDKQGTTLNWPYTIGSAVSITSSIKHDGTSINTENYFFFYDWEIETGGSGSGCVSERVKVDVLTSVKQNADKNITIYPNPANNHLTISNLGNENVNIEIYNSNMQQIKHVSSNGNTVVEFNISGLSSGVYFAK